MMIDRLMFKKQQQQQKKNPTKQKIQYYIQNNGISRCNVARGWGWSWVNLMLTILILHSSCFCSSTNCVWNRKIDDGTTILQPSTILMQTNCEALKADFWWESFLPDNLFYWHRCQVFLISQKTSWFLHFCLVSWKKMRSYDFWFSINVILFYKTNIKEKKVTKIRYFQNFIKK